MDRVRWGVLGYGVIARESGIPGIVRAKNACLYAVASRDSEKLEACKEAFNPDVTYQSYDELLADPLVDAVYLPLPNSLHKEWAQKAMKMGKHVLCEKPLAMSSKDASDMAKAAQDNGVLLMEAFMYRYTDKTKKVLELVDSGAIGDIRHIYFVSHFLHSRKDDYRLRPEMGGGALYDVGIYGVNFATMLMKEAPVSVSSEAVMEGGVDLSFNAMLRYGGGAVACIVAGFDAYRIRQAVITGTRGIIEIPNVYLGIADSITLTNDEGRRTIETAESDRFRLEVEDFSNSIQKSLPAGLPAEESVLNLEIVERLFDSAKK